jgi:hypothetical protein
MADVGADRAYIDFLTTVESSGHAGSDYPVEHDQLVAAVAAIPAGPKGDPGPPGQAVDVVLRAALKAALEPLP